MSIVIDSSAVLELLKTAQTSHTWTHPSIDGHDLNAPHLIDPEVLNSVRKMAIRRVATASRLDQMVTDYVGMEIERHRHGPLLDRVWVLRHNITPYDALYVALAEELELPLITADRRLARAAAEFCDVRTIA
jgi:predicted nucleic acid-binding protein